MGNSSWNMFFDMVLRIVERLFPTVFFILWS